MPINKCKDQNSQTLLEFYEEISDENGSIVNVGLQMIRLINRINNTFIETQLFALTSHARLIILSENSATSNWTITIGTSGFDQYYIDYLIPEEKSPWQNARVSGETNKIEDAIKYILISMRESGEWGNCEELERLIRDMK